MSIYSYPESTVVDEITFRKSEGGHTRAYLHAAPGAKGASLYDITCRLSEKGWQVTPYSIGSKDLLEVHGFRSNEQLLGLLEQQGWARGTRRHTPVKEDKLSFKEQLKKRSLAASGAFYVVGDAAFTKYGYEGASNLNIAAGILYGLGTGSLLLGGRKDQSDLQVREISRKMAQYMKEHGDKIPESCSLESITNDHKRGLIKSADDLFRRYPSELMNLFYAAAGTCIAVAAHKQMKEHVKDSSVLEVLARKQAKDPGITRALVEGKMNKYHKLESKLDIGLGAMTAASGLFAMLVKEKGRDPDALEKHGLEKLWQNIREKPLAVAGIGYMVSTMCHAVSTAIAWNYADDSRRKSVPWRATFVGANIIAEILLAISSKGHGEGVKSDKSVDHTVISLASEMIVKQPKPLQETLINHLAPFLGRPDVLAIKDEEAARLLREEVENMRDNPWAQAAKSNDVPGPRPSPSAKELPAWQARMSQLAAEKGGQPSLSV